MPTTTPLRSWVAVGTLAVSVFAVTTTEMMPIGLLSDMAGDLEVSDGSIGLSVTLYGLVAGLLAPVWTSWTRQMDRRTLILAITSVFAAGNAVTALVTTYPQLMLVRLAIGVLHGLLWSIVAGIAVRMVPPASAAKAIAIVFTGISSALILGVPAGTAVATWIGWRASFVALAILTCIAWLGVLIAVPRLPSDATMRCSALPALVRNGGLRGVLALTAMVVIANYSAYTFISPFLSDQMGVPTSTVGVYLLAYGIAGVVGNVMVGVTLGRIESCLRSDRLLVAGIGVVAAALMALLLPMDPLSAVAVIALWGMTYSALPAMLQTLVFRIAPQAKDAATSLYVSVFNVSIASGAAVGAVGIDLMGPSAPFMAAALFAAVGCCAAHRTRAARVDVVQVGAVRGSSAQT